jgi:hypothetical protein
LESIPSSDALPTPQELRGLRRIRFWQRLFQIWLLAFVVLWPLMIVRFGTRSGFGIGDGNLPIIILGAVFWVAVSALFWRSSALCDVRDAAVASIASSPIPSCSPAIAGIFSRFIPPAIAAGSPLRAWASCATDD